jgi:tryptophanyl-tRNA synthetase
VKKARTDPEPLPEKLEDLEARPEARNLVGIYAALAGVTDQQVLAEFTGQGFGAFKPKLADLAVEKLGPIGGEMRRLLADPAEIDRILAAGAERANAVAAPTMAQVRKLVGFWAG